MSGLRGWEGLWDSSGMVGLRGVPGTPFSPCQDSGDGKDCRTAVVWWDLGESLGLPSAPARTQRMGRTREDSVLTVYFPGTPVSPLECLLFLET